MGDSWTLLLWCDDILLLGAARISFDPLDFASKSEDGVVTFAQAGDGTVTMQVGNKRQSRDVTVLP